MHQHLGVRVALALINCLFCRNNARQIHVHQTFKSKYTLLMRSVNIQTVSWLVLYYQTGTWKICTYSSKMKGLQRKFTVFTSKSYHVNHQGPHLILKHASIMVKRLHLMKHPCRGGCDYDQLIVGSVTNWHKWRKPTTARSLLLRNFESSSRSSLLSITFSQILLTTLDRGIW